jgi:hypothetical protein
MLRPEAIPIVPIQNDLATQRESRNSFQFAPLMAYLFTRTSMGIKLRRVIMNALVVENLSERYQAAEVARQCLSLDIECT